MIVKRWMDSRHRLLLRDFVQVNNNACQMKNENDLAAGVSQPDLVDAFMAQLQHPLKETAVYLRKFILAVDPSIGEGIFWNSPTFYYTGVMEPFDPKTYKRYLVGYNLFKQDAIRLIFLFGATVPNPDGLLTGRFKDQRKIASFSSVAEVKAREADLALVLKALISQCLVH